MHGKIVSRPLVKLPAHITPLHWANVPGVTYPATAYLPPAPKKKKEQLVTAPAGYVSTGELAREYNRSPSTITCRLHRAQCPHVKTPSPGSGAFSYTWEPHAARAALATLKRHADTTGELLSAADAAERIGYSASGLHSLIRHGKLTPHKCFRQDNKGRLRLQNLFDPAELDTIPHRKTRS